MTSTRAILCALGLATMATTTFLTLADPAEAAVCRARMAGEGTGMGIAGQGTEAAKRNALADWSRKVEAKHGKRFSNTAKARSVRYDCRQGAILEAKCVVTAVPCR